MSEIVDLEAEVACWVLESLPVELLRRAKVMGVTDARLAQLVGATEPEVARQSQGAPESTASSSGSTPARRSFPPRLPTSIRPSGPRARPSPSSRRKVMILGSGPNRIGQGIEFDYCCVHAALALGKLGIETIMVNCNPETVSTDYDTSDRLYFEPLTLEHVLAVCETEKPDGVIVQLGGQTPLKLAKGLEAAGVPIWGTSPGAIDLAEDRKLFGALLAEEGIRQPENGTARTLPEALAVARQLGFPVLVRPSYVLGGPGDGDLLRRRDAGAFHDPGRGGLGRAPGAPRSLPRGRHRVRSRPDRRRRDRRGLRHPRAHRGGWRSLGGLGRGAFRRTMPRRRNSTRCAAWPSGWPCASTCAGS